jgi:hypothetical protein
MQSSIQFRNTKILPNIVDFIYKMAKATHRFYSEIEGDWLQSRLNQELHLGGQLQYFGLRWTANDQLLSSDAQLPCPVHVNTMDLSLAPCCKVLTLSLF